MTANEINKDVVEFNPDVFLESCVLLLDILETNGEETRLSESTTHFFGHLYGASDMQVYATATYVSVSFVHEGRYYSASSRINIGKDFRKVSKVNRFIRSLSDEKMDLEKVRLELKTIKSDNEYYPNIVRYIGMFTTSASLAFILGGTIADMLPAGLAGMIGVIVNEFVDRKLDVSFLSEFCGAFAVGSVVCLLSLFGIEGTIFYSAYGGLMGLAPGTVLFSGFRELMTRQSSAGLTIVFQGIFTALALGLGLYMSTELFGVNLLPYR